VESAPIATIDQWHSPVLLVQADDARDVPSQQAADLIEGLRSHNIDHDVIMIPNEIHDPAQAVAALQIRNFPKRSQSCVFPCSPCETPSIYGHSVPRWP
jgi:dipeptidyl aminopeptidase/acylaminoacyl peptidase